MNAGDLLVLNGIFDKHLGKMPQNFFYDTKSYTAKAFTKDVLRFNNDYVDVMSFDSLPYYKKILLGDKFNWAGDSLYNIPLKDFQQLVDTAVAKGWSVGWEGDVTEKGFSFLSGFAKIEESSITPDFGKQRIADFKTEATERDHMPHLVDAGLDENEKKCYYLKN